MDEMNRGDLLDRAKALVTDPGEQDHGDALDTFNQTAALWGAYLGKEISGADVAWMMILLKAAMSSQNPTASENYVDVAGYAALAVELSP